MNSSEIIYLLIKGLLVDNYNYYLADNILNANQNDFTLPKKNDYIIYRKNTYKQKYTPVYDYNNTTQKYEITGINNETYQIDFYGSNAENGSQIFTTYLNSSSASNDLIPFGAGIGRVKDLLNLTAWGDRDKFISRYNIIFDLLTNNTVGIPATLITQQEATPFIEGFY